MNLKFQWFHGYYRAIVSSTVLLVGVVTIAGSILPVEQQLLAQTQDDRGVQRANPVPQRQASDRRVALIIGNSEYTTISPLRNPANDARDIATALESLNFDRVIPVYDANLEEMKQAVEEFYHELKRGSVGVFYYAGHGVQSNGENYLIPIDANIERESQLITRTLPITEVLNTIADAGNDVSIVILDACRDNPFRSWRRNASRGLASLDAPQGVLIAYATAPGSVAADGQGENGTFTEALLKYIETPGLPVELLFKEVRRDVQTATANRQTPWEASSLVGDFSFKPASEPITIRPRPNSNTPAPTLTPTPRSTLTPILGTGESKFFCNNSGDAPVTVMVSDITGDSVPLITWESSYFEANNLNPEAICQQASTRLQVADEQGLFRYLTTGIVDDLPAICATDGIGGGCKILIIKLAPDVNPDEVLMRLLTPTRRGQAWDVPYSNS
jgi:hypothetical protein